MAPLRLAVLSMHTSPLAQAGTGDGGGMNVYVRELASALAHCGVECEVFTRAEHPSQRSVRSVEPGFRVHHVPAGPISPVPKEALADLVPEWTAAVRERLALLALDGRPVDAIHANYWLSGVAGHALKHELGVPLLVTFHTLDRVKADASPEEISFSEPARRALAESETIGCADAVLASCSVEADQLVELYGAQPDRIVVVSPGVNHAFFGPGNQAQARRAVGLDRAGPLVLFAGRIQPLKGLTVAVDALASLRSWAAGPDDPLSGASLVVIGGPSGPHGEQEMAEVRRRISLRGLHGSVTFVPPQGHEVLSTYYRSADVCIVPSHSESFGLVALEAAACGKPVVASAVGGLTTLVADRVTGFLVEGRDPIDYAAPMASLIGDPVLAARIGRSAADAAGAYTWRAAAEVLRGRVEMLASSALVACV
jgi:D-inositol-3-phosphate glycosyltransferase